MVSEIISTLPPDKRTGALKIAEDLLDYLELSSGPIMPALMKAKRLARLIGDNDAQVWLTLETTGYPKGWHIAKIGTCRKYAVMGGRILEDGRYYMQSLPDYEAQSTGYQAYLASFHFPVSDNSADPSSPNLAIAMHVSNARQQRDNAKLVAYRGELNATRQNLQFTSSLANGMRSAVHTYAMECHQALSLGDAILTLFDGARRTVDVFVRAIDPKAAEQLASAFERFEVGDGEALSHALTSCRRLLMTVADVVFPPRDMPYVDLKGNKRKVGQEEYKNRLLAFIGEKISSKSSRAGLLAEIEHLADRLDKFYESACKGVHADVTKEEARIVIGSAYLYMAELARLAGGGQVVAATLAGAASPQQGEPEGEVAKAEPSS